MATARCGVIGSIHLLGLFVAATIAPVATSAHQLGEDPVWCAQQATVGSPHAQPGTLPGPERNHKMTNIELSSFELGKEIPALLGRDARVRFWLMEPGGLIGEHCHEDRPAYVYLLQGEVIETIEVKGKTETRKIRAGEVAREGNGTRHWWKNESNQNVLMVAVDLPNLSRARRPAPNPNDPDNNAATHDAEAFELGSMLLRDQYPHITGLRDYRIRGQRITLRKNGVIGLGDQKGNPEIAYIIDGVLLEHRSDATMPAVRLAGDVSIANDGIWNYWRNVSDGDATLLVIEFVDCADCAEAGTHAPPRTGN